MQGGEVDTSRYGHAQAPSVFKRKITSSEFKVITSRLSDIPCVFANGFTGGALRSKLPSDARRVQRLEGPSLPEPSGRDAIDDVADAGDPEFTFDEQGPLGIMFNHEGGQITVQGAAETGLATDSHLRHPGHPGCWCRC